MTAASERYAGPVEPDAVDRAVTAAEASTLYQRHVKGRLRGLTGRVVKAATCLYTVTPDAHFIVDQLHDDGVVIAASACSGHGFKHSPAIGERLAQLAMQGSFVPEPHFALARFG